MKLIYQKVRELLKLFMYERSQIRDCPAPVILINRFTVTKLSRHLYMHANSLYMGATDFTWSLIEIVSSRLKYTDRKNPTALKTYSEDEIADVCKKVTGQNIEIDFIHSYLGHRSEALNRHAANLRNKDEARDDFERIRMELQSNLKPVMNKRSKIGQKKEPLYLASIVNMIAEDVCGSEQFFFDPHELAYFTGDFGVTCTADRPDGVVPNLRNPLLICETKEYFGSTSYGSRVNDALRVAELNGRRLAVCQPAPIKVFIADDYHTLWVQGKPFCCKLFDLLHRGFLDHILLGREVNIEWRRILQSINISTNDGFFDAPINPDTTAHQIHRQQAQVC